VGAALVLRVRTFLPLVIALTVMVIVAVTVRMLGRSNPPWVEA
jgi:TRAP-type C4-dicarboxylate transport system permease small subunit